MGERGLMLVSLSERGYRASAPAAAWTRLVRALARAASPAALGLSLLIVHPAVGAAAPCSRADLSKLADSYLAALAAHDPSALRFAPDVKHTENGRPMKIGEGFWRTADAPITFQRQVLDAEDCSVLTQAVMKEGAATVIVGARLKRRGDEIAESELVIARPKSAAGSSVNKTYNLGGSPFELFDMDPNGVALEDGDYWESILPPAERRSPEEMKAIADKYFVLFDVPSTQVAWGHPCNRYENGTRTTKDDCYTKGPGGLKITNRRFPVVDVEKGIVVGYGLFGGRILDFHMFKIRDGKITQIQVLTGPATGTMGWE